MSSGTQKTMRGAFTGTGSAITVETLGFRPGVVRLINRGGLVTADWNDAMPDASAAKRVTAGDMTFITSNGITPTSKGFTVGADTDINVSGELVYWEAVEG